ncbi:MAG: hypothetical protein DRJ60_00100 [Thermoprotei archaeon]|nr:MAG: hypothetical protein DRJ60_00100 [Thermoprotei archaeon]
MNDDAKTCRNCKHCIDWFWYPNSPEFCTIHDNPQIFCECKIKGLVEEYEAINCNYYDEFIIKEEREK